MDTLTLSALNYVDIIIAGSFLLFIIIGIVRGFTNDILSLLTWLGAVLATKELFPLAQPYARNIISEPFFSDVILSFLIFIISLIFLVSIAKGISKCVRKSVLSGLDRTFGIISGSLRALVILVGAYFIMLMFYKTGEAPVEVRNARLLPIVHIPACYAHDYLIPKDLFPKRLLKHLYGEQSVYQDTDDIPGLVASLSSPKARNGNPQASHDESSLPASSQQATSVKSYTQKPQNGYSLKDQKTKEQVALEMLIDKMAP